MTFQNSKSTKSTNFEIIIEDQNLPRSTLNMKRYHHYGLSRSCGNQKSHRQNKQVEGSRNSGCLCKTIQRRLKINLRIIKDEGIVNIFNLAKIAGTSVDQI